MAKIRTKGPGIRIWPDGETQSAVSLVLTAEGASDGYDVTQYQIGGGSAGDHVVAKAREITLSFVAADEGPDGAPQDPTRVVETLRSWARSHLVVVVESDWSASRRWLIQGITIASSPDMLWTPTGEISLVEYRQADVSWSTVRFPRRIRKKKGKKKPSPVVSGSTDGLLPVSSTKKANKNSWLSRFAGLGG